MPTEEIKEPVKTVENPFQKKPIAVSKDGKVSLGEFLHSVKIENIAIPTIKKILKNSIGIRAKKEVFQKKYDEIMKTPITGKVKKSEKERK